MASKKAKKAKKANTFVTLMTVLTGLTHAVIGITGAGAGLLAGGGDEDRQVRVASAAALGEAARVGDFGAGIGLLEGC